jgi:hypothetical protein
VTIKSIICSKIGSWMIWKIDTSVATHTAVASDTIVIVAGIIIAKIGSIVVVAEMN